MKESSIRWQVLAMVMSGVFLSTMDSGMINIALPTIMRSFHLNLEYAEFVVSLYLLTITVTLVFWGRLGDRLGRGRVYFGGMAIFAIGSLACYCSPNFGILLFSRFIQALGASMMMASGPAIIKMVFPVDQLGRSLGLVGVATACGLLTGPYVSGFALGNFSWRIIFLVTLPVSLSMLLFGRAYLLSRLPVQANSVTESFDWRGSLVWVTMTVLGVWIFHRFDLLLTPYHIALLFLLLLLLLLFIHIEKGALHPIVPISLFSERFYWIGVATAVISFVSLFSVLVLVPFFLEYALQLPIEKVGKIMMAVPATLIIVSPLSGRLYDRIGARLLTTVGMGVSTLALLSITYLSPESTEAGVMGRLAVLGAGQSIFLTPNSASLLSKVDERFSGVTAGILATARNFGMMTGATLAAALFAWWFGYFSGNLISHYSLADKAAFLLAWRFTLLIMTGLAMVGAFISAQRQ